MRRNRRIALHVLSSAVLISAIAGCSGGTKNNAASSASPGSNATAAATKAPEKRLKMQIWSTTPEKVVSDSYALKLLKDRFNIDIDVFPRNNDTYKQNLQLKLASGEAPDWFNDLDFKDYNKLVDQGVLAEIPPDLLAKYAPKYMQWLKKQLGDNPFLYTLRNGKNYSMPSVWTPGPKGMVVGIRQDWLNKVGIAKVPETIDELEAAMIKFRNEDPDGNGKKDTYGLTGNTDFVTNIFSFVFGAYGVYTGIFTEKDGKVVLGEVEPGAKDALTTLNRWYKEELIDPEFVVNKFANVDEKVISEKVGVASSYWWKFIPADAFSGGNYYDKLVGKNPAAKWTITSGPKGPKGDFGIAQSNPILNSGLLFAKSMEKDQDKMIKYIQLFEATSFDMSLYEKLKYGEEGKTYKKTGGDIEWIAPYDKEEERIKFGTSYFNAPGSFNDYDLLAPYMTKSQYMTVRKEAEAKGTGKYDLLNPIQRPVFDEYKDRLDQFVKKNLVEFITGKRPISEFDKYVEEWKQMGGDKVMAEAQQKYSEVFKK